MDSRLDFGVDGIEVLEELCSIDSSDTQAIKLVKIDKEGTVLYSLQKWWKKDPDEDWRVGKGFQLTPSQFKELATSISKNY